MPEEKYGSGDVSYRAAGGEPGIRKLVEAFYEAMDVLPEAKVIRKMHPRNLEVSIDKLALFLCGWLGGPKRFHDKYGPINIPKVHSHLRISESEKAAWLKCMESAVAKQDYPERFKAYLLTQLEVPAERIRLACQAKFEPEV